VESFLKKLLMIDVVPETIPDGYNINCSDSNCKGFGDCDCEGDCDCKEDCNCECKTDCPTDCND